MMHRARAGCTRFAYIHVDSKTDQSCVPNGHGIGHVDVQLDAAVTVQCLEML
jgi:hypothetical protein